MFALKELLTKCGSVNLVTQAGAAFDPKTGRASYIFNPTIAGIDQANALLIVGSNPRKEAAVLNARIRKRWRTGTLKIGVNGAKADLTYPYDNLGAGTDSLSDLAAGKHSFADVLKGAKHPIVLVGAGATSRRCGAGPGRQARWMSAPSRTAGTGLPCCSLRPRRSAHSISVLRRRRAVSVRRR